MAIYGNNDKSSADVESLKELYHIKDEEQSVDNFDAAALKKQYNITDSAEMTAAPPPAGMTQKAFAQKQKEGLKEEIAAQGRGLVKGASQGYADLPGREGQAGEFLGEAALYIAADIATGGLGAIPAAAGIATKIPWAAKALKFARPAITMGAVGLAQPAKDIQERIENAKWGAALGFVPSILGGAGKWMKGKTADVASATTGIAKETIKDVGRLGAAKTFAEKNLAKDALKNETEKIQGAFESWRLGAKVDKASISKRAAKIGETARVGVEDTLESYGEQIEKAVTDMPQFAKKNINTNTIIAKVDAYVNKLNADPLTALSPSETAEINKLRQSLIGIGNVPIGGPTSNILFPTKDQVPEMRLSIPEAQAKKQLLYKINKRAYENPNITDTVKNANKIAADAINQAIRASDPTGKYAKANANFIKILDLKDELTALLKLKKPGESIEKTLLALEKKDVSAQRALRKLNKLMPGDKKFLNDLNIMLDDPNYQLAVRLEGVLGDKASVDRLSKVVESARRPGVMGSDIYTLEDLKLLEGKVGKPFMDDLRRIAVAEEFAGLKQGGMDKAEGFVRSLPFGKFLHSARKSIFSPALKQALLLSESLGESGTAATIKKTAGALGAITAKYPSIPPYLLKQYIEKLKKGEAVDLPPPNIYTQ